MSDYKPEGYLINTVKNQMILTDEARLREAFIKKTIIEARAILCDSDHNLIVDLGNIRGIIPKNECAIGVEEGYVRDIAIISRVNKPVCFVITGFETSPNGATRAILSRRIVQKRCMNEYINLLNSGDIIPARITHIEPFGCFVDIACGIPSLLPIDAISISRISHPSDRFKANQDIYVIVKSKDNERITLTHKELLGTWEQNVKPFAPGQTVPGIIRSIENYGIFVELTPNLAGLAEIKEGVKVGDRASVYIKSIIPDKMKIKLIIVESFSEEIDYKQIQYHFSDNHIDYWRYSPSVCTKTIESMF